MESRKIGQEGLITSCIGLGCMGMSAFYGPTDQAENDAVLDSAVLNGVTLFDTADMYGDGQNEELIGAFLKRHSERLCVATKAGIRSDAKGQRFIDNTPEYIKQACDASLSRLGVEVIDLYYLHRRNPDVPIAESVGAMRDLRDAGKIREIGLSEVSPETLVAATNEAPIAALQIEYSLTERSPEQKMIPVAREHGITVVAYSPLGRGLLTGRFTAESDFAEEDYRPRVHPRLHGKNLASNVQIVDNFDAIACDIGLPKSSLALAWLLSRGEGILPIPGTRSTKYLQQNIEATYVHLPAEILTQIDELFAEGQIVGERYNEEGMKYLNC